MTTPFVAAAAYVLLTAQAPAVHGLGGDSMPVHLQGLGRPCQTIATQMDPWHAHHLRHDRPGNHVSVRWRGWHDQHPRHHEHPRHGHYDDLP
jgi:hypothetical protein